MAQSMNADKDTGATTKDDTAALREQINQLRADLNTVSHEIGSVGRAYVERGKAASRAAGNAAEEQLREHPLAAVAGSLMAGFLLGLLLGGRGRG